MVAAMLMSGLAMRRRYAALRPGAYPARAV
jgi:hypothetical protein